MLVLYFCHRSSGGLPFLENYRCLDLDGVSLSRRGNDVQELEMEK